MNHGRQLYEAHMQHMFRRKAEPGYLDPDCPACKLHREKEQQAAERKNVYQDLVDESKRYQQNSWKVRHKDD